MAAHAIHHVTAVTRRIEVNLDFYLRVLGLRLVKRTVNQDDVSAYHLFYADAVGSPGTDLTFFDWPMAAPNQPGPGTVARIHFRIPAQSVAWWKDRLTTMGAECSEATDEAGRPRLLFSDPEGQRLGMVEAGDLPNDSQPWDRVIPKAHAVTGIIGIDIESLRPDSTRRVLTDLLDYREADGVLTSSDARSFGQVRLVEPKSGTSGRVGAGGVHHVAFSMENEEELILKMQQVEEAGHRTSGVIDRFYFKSVYFREPGGILFEMATRGPGFGADEDMDALGERLALPPFLEPHRARIEAGLKPLPELVLS